MSCRVSPPRMALKSRLTLDSCGTVLDIIEPKYIYTHRASCPRQRSFFGTCQKWQGYWHLEHRNIPSKTSFHRPSHILNRFKYSLGVTEDAWTNSTVLMSLLFLKTTVMNCFFECCWRFPSPFLIDSATKRGASCSTQPSQQQQHASHPRMVVCSIIKIRTLCAHTFRLRTHCISFPWQSQTRPRRSTYSFSRIDSLS